VDDDESRKKLMDIIQHDVQRLDRLISDISSASRLDAELSREEMEDVNLTQLLYSLRDAHKKPLSRTKETESDEETNIRLNIPASQKIIVRGNEDRLAQVFGNLLTNALSFSPENGLVEVRILSEEEQILVQVEDQGPGIPENKLETIFERFYTERPGNEDYGSHSGLGLSISRQIIQAHNGSIWAQNMYDRAGSVMGARFNIVLNAA